MQDIILYGHYSNDILITKQGVKHETLGGAPAYMTPFFEATGITFQVVSKVGSDFHYKTHNPVQRSSRPTTAFLNDNRAERVQHCTSTCEPITPGDVKDDCKVAVLCGIANEIPIETIRAIHKRAKYLVADMQGFCREFLPDGTVKHVNPTWLPLELLDYVKISSAEAETVPIKELRKHTNVLLTKNNGCMLYRKDIGEQFIPGFTAEEKDSTGAGDAFLAGFSYGLLLERAAEECCRIGNYFGALSVQHVGVPIVTKADIERYKTTQ